MKYTKKLHIEGLIILLLRENPSHYCPANFIEVKYYNFYNKQYFNDHICPMCREFININSKTQSNCPCNILKKEEVFKRLWIKLEEVLDKNNPFLNDPSFSDKDIFDDS